MSQSLLVTRAEVPTYPPVAMGAGLTSTVRVSVTIKKGRVSGARILTSTGSEAFDRPTLANIRTWQFSESADTAFVTTFTYEMTDTVTERPENARVELKLPLSVRLVGSRSKPRKIIDAEVVRSKPPLR